MNVPACDPPEIPIGFGNVLFYPRPGDNPGIFLDLHYSRPSEFLDQAQCETLYAELQKLLGKPTAHLGVDTGDVLDAWERLQERGEVDPSAGLTDDETQLLFWEALKGVSHDVTEDHRAIERTLLAYAEHNHLTPQEATNA